MEDSFQQGRQQPVVFKGSELYKGRHSFQCPHYRPEFGYSPGFQNFFILFSLPRFSLYPSVYFSFVHVCNILVNKTDEYTHIHGTYVLPNNPEPFSLCNLRF